MFGALLEPAMFMGMHWGGGRLARFGFGAATAAYAKRKAARVGLKEGATWFGARAGSLEASYGRRMRRDVWGAFFKRGQGTVGQRWLSAQQAASMRLFKSGAFPAGLTKTAVSRAAGAALGANVLSVGVNYMAWGFVPPLLMDMAIGGFNSMAEIGKELRQRGPMTATRFADTRQAMTMRQAGMQAIHESGLGGFRNTLGSEANQFHRG